MSKRTKQTKTNATSTGSTSTLPDAAAAYTVLARRYRSRDFDELIGQEPIARTLQNAIATGRTAHAYLFCGTRGVGKTSMARIFARALNVDDSLEQKDAIADAIFRGDDLDVIEIDGASNRGIADAKDLIAGAGLSPARCRYKIYIIDEVHALTKDAFNALLKTMEEPPAHVKFILCTTEANKVPATIQSRCQRFDFRPLSVAKISEQLRMILQDEGIEAGEDVIARVAQLGNGSMRDALSLLDRLLAAGERTLTVDLLEQMVGLPDQSLILDLMSTIIAGDASEALTRADRLISQGTTIEQTLELLLEHLRALMVMATCGPESELVELAGESRQIATEQAQHFDAAGLVHLIALCDAVHRNARNSAAGRALFDAAIVRMSMSEHFASLTDLVRGKVTTVMASGHIEKKNIVSSRPEPVAPASPAAITKPVQRPSESSPDVNATELTEVKPAARTEEPLTAEALWQQVMTYSGHSRIARTKLECLNVHSLEGNTLRLYINEEGASSARLLRKSIDEITSLICTACGRSLEVQLDEPSHDLNVPAASSESDIAMAEQLPLVSEAMEIFDAHIIHVSDD